MMTDMMGHDDDGHIGTIDMIPKHDTDMLINWHMTYASLNTSRTQVRHPCFFLVTLAYIVACESA